MGLNLKDCFYVVVGMLNTHSSIYGWIVGYCCSLACLVGSLRIRNTGKHTRGLHHSPLPSFQHLPRWWDRYASFPLPSMGALQKEKKLLSDVAIPSIHLGWGSELGTELLSLDRNGTERISSRSTVVASFPGSDCSLLTIHDKVIKLKPG